jgi:alpha-tubulin suppressor-like RCC1 family protein
MARIKVKTRVIVAAIVFVAVGIASLMTASFSDSWGRGRLRLPVGNVTPAISVSERHGLILASDGSLWSWGSDFLGWPVLGLGNLTNRSTSLRRIGRETNWVGISAAAGHNLAVKSDGTLWTWGESVQGPSGRPTPINAPALAAPGNDWKQAAAGGVHSVALKKDGTLWAWGHNWAGSLGIPATNGSSVPLQVGSATNWIKVWAGILETVAMQSDGSLWYWGENPNPAFAQGASQIFVPTRVSPDTNWVDVGFGVNTVFAIKSDGTLWAWGRNAEVFTGAGDTAQDAAPARVGTNSDWRFVSDCTGWWCQGLIKKDGSLWVIDASNSKPNGPRSPYQPVKFRRVEFQKNYVAYAAGAAHAAAPGVHGPIGVVLTRDGEVWTWGMILGDPPTMKARLAALEARIAGNFHFKIPVVDPEPVYREKPWQLRNVKPDDAPANQQASPGRNH